MQVSPLLVELEITDDLGRAGSVSETQSRGEDLGKAVQPDNPHPAIQELQGRNAFMIVQPEQLVGIILQD